MSVRVIAIGKKRSEPWVEAGIEHYSKRLRRPFAAEWVILPHSTREGSQARQEESKSILGKLAVDDFVLLLDERGKQLTSPAFSQLLQDTMMERGKMTAVIGGAYGVNDELRERADTTLSLSEMVLPHQLARLLLAEQLYRAQEIANGGPYHHE